MRSDILLRAGDPDIFSPLAPALARFADRNGTTASAELMPGAPYADKIFRLDRKKNDFHVVVADEEVGQDLITRGLVVPLNGFFKKSPQVIAGIADIALQKFSRDGRYYGVPLWHKGELMQHAYMVIRAGRQRGMASKAMRLIAFLKSEIPLSGLPDLIVENLSVKTAPVRPAGKDTLSAGEVVDGDGENITVMVKAVIANVGEAVAEDFDITISIGREKPFVTQQRVASLAPGVRHEVYAEIEIPAPGGEYTIEDLQPLDLEIDDYNGVLEANDLNNSLSRFHWNEEWVDISAPDPPAAHNPPFEIEPQAYIGENSGMSPKVAFDGDNFLVVWARQEVENYSVYQSFNHTLRGALIDQNGSLLQIFDITTTEGHYSHYNIGFNGTHYFVVWSRRFIQSNGIDPNSLIEGTAITKQGVVLHDPPIAIEDRDLYGWPDRISHQSPDIIFDGQNLMVTYVSNIQNGDANSSEDPAGIYARQVSPTWNVSSVRVPIFTFDKLHSSWWAHQRTGFLDHKAILAFQGLRTGDVGGLTVEMGIYGIWMDIDPVSGTPSSEAPVLLDGDYSEDHFPHGSYEWPAIQGADNARFLTLWHGNPSYDSPTTIMRSFGQGLNSGGGYFNQKSAVTTGPLDRHPAADYRGSTFTVAFQHLEGCKTYLAALNIDRPGTVSVPTVFYNAGDLVGQADIAFGSQVGLIVYELHGYGTRAVNGIWGQFIEIPEDD